MTAPDVHGWPWNFSSCYAQLVPPCGSGLQGKEMRKLAGDIILLKAGPHRDSSARSVCPGAGCSCL